MRVVQNLEFKYVDLLSCYFKSSTDDAVKAHASMRYNAMREKAGIHEARLADVHSKVCPGAISYHPDVHYGAQLERRVTHTLATHTDTHSLRETERRESDRAHYIILA